MLAQAQTWSNRFLNARLALFGLVYCVCLLFCTVTHAQTATPTEPPKNYMLWPLLPDETLESLAKQLYPQSPILQQRFIKQAIALTRNHSAQSTNTLILSADTQFKHPQLIAVPHAQALTALTHRIKKAEELIAMQNQTANTFADSPFSDHRLSFHLSAPPQTQQTSALKTPLDLQDKDIKQDKHIKIKETEADIALSQVISENLPSAGVAIEPPSKTAPNQTFSNTTAYAKPERPNHGLLKQIQMQLSAYWHTAKANLQANLQAIKHEDIQDWLQHESLKWICLELIVLTLPLLYAFTVKRLAHQKSAKQFKEDLAK